MPVHISFHENNAVRSRDGHPYDTAMIGPRIANAQSLAVGAVASSTAAPRDCFARLVITEACRVEVGAVDAAHASNSAYWPANSEALLFVPEGKYVSIIAAA